MMKLAEVLRTKRNLMINSRANAVIREISDKLLNEYPSCGNKEFKHTVKPEFTQDEVVAEVLAYFTSEGLGASFNKDTSTYTVVTS